MLCRTCQAEKPLIKGRLVCSDCLAIKKAAYYQKNATRLKAYQASYYEAHKAEINPVAVQRMREWVSHNRVRYNIQQIRYYYKKKIANCTTAEAKLAARKQFAAALSAKISQLSQ